MPKWTVGDGTSITKSAATGSPTACQTLQNGVPVLTILWQDSGAKSMVYAQIDPGNAANTLAFDTVGVACLDSPWIAQGAGPTFLAYASSDGAVNLAIDPAGGVNFAFKTQLTLKNAGATYGPAFMPLNRTLGYLFWPTIQHRQRLGRGGPDERAGAGHRTEWNHRPSRRSPVRLMCR